MISKLYGKNQLHFIINRQTGFQNLCAVLQINECFFCMAFLPAVDVVKVWNLTILVNMQWCLLFCSFLMMNTIVAISYFHIFILILYIFFDVTFQIFFSFLNWIFFVFLMLSFKSYLYILGISLLSDMSLSLFADIFLRSCLFHILTLYFVEKKHFVS